MWAWADDPIVNELFKHLNLSGINMGVPDVLPALSTGKINACYGSPLAAVALQWYTKVKFATAKPISYSSGALIVRKAVFDKLSAADQALLLKAGHDVGEKLKSLVRKDNERAKAAMKKSGIQFVETPKEFVKELIGAAGKTHGSLGGGKLYKTETLKQLRAILKGK